MEEFDDMPKPCLIAGISMLIMLPGVTNLTTHMENILKQLKNVTWYLSITDLELSPQVKGTLIDITLCSSDISHSFSWSTLDDPHGSDHLPIIIETNCMYPTGETKTHKIWNLKKANWSQYQTTLETKDPPVYYHQLIDAINEAATISIPKNSTVRHSQHIPKPWWNSECDSAVNNRKRHISDSNLIQIKRIF
ncbi:hypothetical protein JTB14_024989 [Gonioctena quinquepunctata]|nr:hypothetical protein JTB14_024989 [Gonioctena quinquepunctata]